MITTGEDNAGSRVADALEEVIEKLDDLIAARPQELKVSVPAQKPPTVTVEAPARPRAWIFKVTSRDSEGFIETVTATPKF